MSNGSLDWQACPRKAGKVFPWALVRTPKGGGVIEATIVSPAMVGCWTHFYDGRTYPHKIDDCPACAGNMKREWHGYFAALRESNGQKLIIEVTERVGGFIEHWQSQHRTLRGSRIRLHRAGKAAHSKIHVDFHRELVETILHVPSQELKEILCHIWKQPTLLASSIEIEPPRIAEPETGGPPIIFPGSDRAAG